MGTSSIAHREKRAPLTLKNTHGFTLVATRHIDELNMVAYEWQHDRTGAPYYHIDTNDRNSTFCIGFRTPANDSKGTTHVLEHTTLCGSKKFPVRAPFFMMIRRSLSSFMNAMTGADFTLYPFATTNRQDFCNLLDVYLDAVFHPLLRKEDFRQEGHRVEVERKGDSRERRLVYNGVVFNEMRGVVSEPAQHYINLLTKSMFPGTHYEHISGGYPPDVLRLTHEEILAFHRKHYHPTNSITFTCSEHSPEQWMATLDAYFSTFEKGTVVKIPRLAAERRFNGLRKISLEGPLNPMGNPQRQKRVSLSFGIQEEEKDLKDVVELSVLDSLLSGGPSSPLYHSLIGSQIGSRYTPMHGHTSCLSTSLISYGVEGVDETRPNSEEEVLSAIVSTLEKVQSEGFDQRRVRSVIFQEELHQRHRAADYGVSLCTSLCIMGLCRATINPLDFIDWLPHLRRLGEEGAKSLLSRISRNLLDNPHRALITVSAKKDFLNSLRDTLSEMESKLNEGATNAEMDKVEQDTALWLERVCSPQDSDVLPTLSVKDISPVSFQEPQPRPVCSSVDSGSSLPSSLFGPHTIAYPTNGLVYVHGIIPFGAKLADSLRGVDNEKMTDIPLSHSLLGNLGAGPYSFKEFSIATELVCGGFTFSPQVNQSYRNKSEYICGTSYSFCTTKEKLREALELLKVVLLEPRTSPESDEVCGRAISIVKARCSSVIQRIQREGNHIATSLAISQLTRSGALREEWFGLARSTHASAMLEDLQSGDNSVVRRAISDVLNSHSLLTQSLVLNIRHGVLWATCEEEHRREVGELLAAFLNGFTEDSVGTLASMRIQFPSVDQPHSVRQIRISLPIDTSYVGFAIANELDWNHKHQAPLRVACQLLANEYLHRRVREEGGAYGSSAKACHGGDVGGITMSSYRDPTPENTVKVFEEAGSWLSDAKNISKVRVDEAKLRLFAKIDAPYSVDSFGESYFLHDMYPEQKQAMRDALLSVEPKDVVEVAQFFDLNKNPAAVIGILCPEEVSGQ
ncbi:putative pitrilysin-like metalloprotease [Trypanosoma vivax]|nr:putative pitrilysin-like metalloprotease [Trypanosoma vivax]